MPTVRAKFEVQSVTEHKNYDKSKGNLKTIRLTPVTSGSPENEQFYAYTPGGQIELSTVNAEAAKEFAPGRQVYVDFTFAD